MRSNRLNLDKIRIFHEHLRPRFLESRLNRSSCTVAPKENSLNKIYRSEFLQSSLIFVMYLLKEVYRKIMSEIHFVGKTRYEDLTETGS